MKTFRSAVYVALALLAVVAMSACAGNPSAPTSSGYTTPATTVITHSVPIEGSTTPFVLKIEELKPEKGSQLTVGQNVVVSATISGPVGYEAMLLRAFRSGDSSLNTGVPTAFDKCRMGGGVYNLAPNVNLSLINNLVAQQGMPNVDDITYVVRVRPIGAEWPSCDRFAEVSERLDLRAPAN